MAETEHIVAPDATTGEFAASPDLLDISSFLAVAEQGSFTAAAQVLGLSKSNVSRRVSRLEKTLGARLLQRSTRKLSLTEVGQAYQERVKLALDRMNEAAASIRSLQNEAVGKLRMTAPIDLGGMLSELIVEFTRAHPKVDVEMVVTQKSLDLVAEGFDLALRAGTLPDSDLVARKLQVAGISLYTSPEYARLRGIPQTVEELDKHDLVLFKTRQRNQTWELHRNDGERVSYQASGRISADDFQFCANVIVSGGGIGFLAETVAHCHASQGRLIRVLPEWKGPDGGLYLVYPSAKFLSTKVRVFRDFALQWIASARPCQIGNST